jgi:hypothetical protein
VLTVLIGHRVKRLLRRGAVVVGVAALGAVMALGVGQLVRDLAPSWHAMRGDGIRGTFTADETFVIGRGGDRVWRGRFVSDDGSVVRERVELAGAVRRMAIGRPVPAIDTGADRDVFARPGYGAFVEQVRRLLVLGLFGLGGGLGGGLVAVWSLRRWLRRRTPTATTARSGPT